MPPAKRKAPLPPVPGIEETPPELCTDCFPEGLAGTPEGATVVSCRHGAWQVSDLVQDPDGAGGEGQSPADPNGTQGPEGQGDGKGDGGQ
ncbi:hypothetical protein [Streptosporangium sp. NPDC020145]|uniref:hypothetical protein n=1 Tax=Streptosporangium sp. NPDC020145 TaxID=3154694 RepID=UPI00343F7970